MELKMKYQYTYFIHPYIVDKTKYDKYVLRLLKDKRCGFKIFEKEKDMNIYNYFLPHFRNYIFPTFDYRAEKLKDFQKLKVEQKAKIIADQTCCSFTYTLAENVKGKMDDQDLGIFFNIENLEIICFNTGICFLVMKTNVESSNSFNDVLDFNYKFKDIHSELSSLKDFENIRIQTDTFKDVKDISELIEQITGIHKKKKNFKNEFTNESFYTFSYVCLETEHWNDKNDLESIPNDFYRFSNVLPSNYPLDFNKDSLNNIVLAIDKFKYSRVSVTKSASTLLCSGINTYNFTTLPFEYENEYLYTYIIALYQKIFIRKLNTEFKEYQKITELRKDFITFTNVVWEKEVTLDDSGSKYYESLKKALELDELYDEIQNKYEVIYKDLNIEKNNRYFTILIMLLIFSMTLNLINVLILLYKWV